MSCRSILSNASNLEIHDSQFTDNSLAINISHHTTNNIGPTANNISSGGTDGLRTLLSHCIPEALHDSSARDPPPRCHPGTRYGYIDRITHWGLNSNGRQHRMIWLYGPAGVGKSAVAQSCAEAIAEKGNLGAAFFFSMPNKRDKADLFFTTIAYQLAMKNRLCRRLINDMIVDDSTLATKSISHQFLNLILTPLAELRARGEELGELVVIIDGLDECSSNRAQCEIIELIASSIRDRTTPFLWVFVSRPEAHIQTTFASPQISSLCFQMELPVSRDIDHEITKFLTDELTKIRNEHGLPKSWPSERQIGKLVNLSAGLFIYASTVIRFIKDDDSPGPDDQLEAVLALGSHWSTKAQESEVHPLSELDSFYTLIMQRVPPKILPTVQKILLTTTISSGGTIAIFNANMLGLTEAQFRNACRFLYSVLELEGRDHPVIKFYHASFMEFLLDPKRSRNFCVKSDSRVASFGKELIDKLSVAHAKSRSQSTIDIPITWPGPDQHHIYAFTSHAFLSFCQSVPLNHEILTSLTSFSYAKIPVLWETGHLHQGNLEVEQLLQNIPQCFHGKIIRRYPRVLFHATLLERPHRDAIWSRPYVLGTGKNKVLLWPDCNHGSWICPYPTSRVGSMAKFIGGVVLRSRKDKSGKPETSPGEISDSSQTET